MSTAAKAAIVSKPALWIGWILTAAVGAMLIVMSGISKITQPQPVKDGFGHLGWDLELAIPLAVVEIACAVIYVIPRTAVLGAILLTGYLGGAIATHVRIGDAFVIPVVLGLVVWGALYLREPRLRALLPLRR
jgi:DoxX-like protein